MIFGFINRLPRLAASLSFCIWIAWGLSADAGIASVEEGVSSEALADRIDLLRREIARHDNLYFRLAAPEISDFEYDLLKADLLRLEGLYPDDGDVMDLPIGDDRSGAFATQRHRVPMLSLSKAMSEEELLAFHRRMVNFFKRENIAYWVEPKFDGIAISLTYEQGRLVRAVTRGDGREGDDVTANILAVNGVTSELRGLLHPDLLEVRGEIYISFKEFDRINAERDAEGEVAFANPRNLAAGTVKVHDPGEVEERRLEIVFFGWGSFEPEDRRPETLEQFHRMMGAWGLPTVTSPVLAVGWMELRDAVNAVLEARGEFGHPIDGAVVKLHSVEEQDALGWGRTAPHWAVAVKFPPERRATRLLGITLQVGRTGLVTPVAELEPVSLDGARVARATLHNADEIARLDLRIGDVVYVEKAGDVIPVVAGVDFNQRAFGSGPYFFPSSCPACGSPLERVERGGVHRCGNMTCPARRLRRLEHFSAAMKIKGLGSTTIASLVQSGLVRTPADFYRLRREDLMGISGLGERSADNLLGAIDISCEAPWETVVYALGIPGVGPSRARILARMFPDGASMAGAREEQLKGPEEDGAAGFGEAIAASVFAGLADPKMRKLIAELDSVGVKMRKDGPAAPAGIFGGEVIVVTGRLERWSRTEVTARLVAAGARVGEQVTRETTLLIAGEKPGSKLERARILGVPVIDEETLARRWGDPTSRAR